MKTATFQDYLRKSLCALRVDRPLRMFRWFRSLESRFEGAEDLYYRFLDVGRTTHELSDQQLLIAVATEQFRLPNLSVNRALFSRPLDVLFAQYCQWGVMVFAVKHIPNQLPFKPTLYGPAIVKFGPVHEPLAANYAHTAIGVWGQNGKKFGNDKKVNKDVAEEFQDTLGDRARLIRKPSPGERFAWLKRRLGRKD